MGERTEYRTEADRVLREHNDAVPLPRSVYHYTRLDAFLKVITTGKIWCSNVTYANDPAEIIYGDKLLREMLRERFSDFVLKGMFEVVGDIDYYAASFSAEGDLLPQWRAYCRNGRGVAIGFDTPSLLWTTHMIFSRVEYDLDRQKTLASDVMNIYAEPIRKAASDDERSQTLIGELALYFLVLRGIFKQPAYAAEREYRLFNTLPKPRDAHDTDLLFRASESAVIPYFEVEVVPPGGMRAGRSVLNEIVVGPCLDAPTVESIRTFLYQQKLPTVEVRRSEVRMRSD